MYNEIMETNGFLEFFCNAGFLSLAFNADFPQFLIKVLYIWLILIIKVNLLHMSPNVLNVCTQIVILYKTDANC
jgi:hypothetical protein